MITILMGSFPTAKIPEPEIFVRVLMDDVMALDPSFVEMESDMPGAAARQTSSCPRSRK